MLYRPSALLPVHATTHLSRRCNLVDVLSYAPALLAALPSQGWAALSQCSKQLQHLIHSSVTSLSVQESDVKAVLKMDWPQLALLKVQPLVCFAFRQKMPVLKDSKLQLIAYLESTEGLQRRAAFITSAKPQVDQHTNVALAFNQLRGLGWQEIFSLTIIVLSQAESILAQMAQCEWPRLRRLSVPNSRLGHAALTQLATCSWPKLQELDLNFSHLDEAGMPALVQGS